MEIMNTIKIALLSFAVLILATNLMAQQSAPAATTEKTTPATTAVPTTPPAKAESGQPPMGMAEHRAMMLKDRLKLTDAQADKIKSIMVDSDKQAMAEREKFKGTPEDARKASMDRRKATDEKIMAVLNADQKKEYTKMKDEMRGKEKPKMGMMPPAETKK
jgi:Spy/CpxP family protein refolding chaperone